MAIYTKIIVNYVVKIIPHAMWFSDRGFVSKHLLDSTYNETNNLFVNAN